MGTFESALHSFEGISNLITPEPARHKKGICLDSGVVWLVSIKESPHLKTSPAYHTKVVFTCG